MKSMKSTSLVLNFGNPEIFDPDMKRLTRDVGVHANTRDHLWATHGVADKNA